MNNDHPSSNVDVLYGIDNIIDAIEKFIDETKSNYHDKDHDNCTIIERFAAQLNQT